MYLRKHVKDAASIAYNKPRRQRVKQIKKHVAANVEKEKRYKNLIRFSDEQIAYASIILKKKALQSKIERGAHSRKTGVIDLHARVPDDNKQYADTLCKVDKFYPFFLFNHYLLFYSRAANLIIKIYILIIFCIKALLFAKKTVISQVEIVKA